MILRRSSAALCAALALCACGDSEVDLADLLPSVSATVVQSLTLDQEVRASGDLEARLHTTIAAEIAGRVTGIRVEEGAPVESGVVVLEIDPERRQLELDAARAGLAQARAEYGKERRQTARVRKLSSENVTSQQQLEEAEAALELARAQVASARAEVGVLERAVADASVSAPFAGRVARRTVELGEFVQPGDPLFELVALDSLEVVFGLPELDSERVRAGAPVEIEVSAFPKRRFGGSVSFISPTIDPATRTLRVKARVSNEEGLLRPGLFARVRIQAEQRSDVLMVPEDAIIQRSDGAHLFRINGEDRLERVRVSLGAAQAGQVEVRGELAAGDRVVRRGHAGLAEGAQVQVVEGPRSSISAHDIAAETDLKRQDEAEAAEL